MKAIIGKNKYYGYNGKFEYSLTIEEFKIIYYYSILNNKLKILEKTDYDIQSTLFHNEEILDYYFIDIKLSNKELEMLQSNDTTIIKIALIKIINDNYGNIDN